MNKLKRIGLAGVLSLALSLSVAGTGQAALTLGATSAVSTGVLTLTGVGTGTTSATAGIGLTANTTSTIVIGGPAQTGAINIADPASTAVSTINIGTNAQANVVTIGSTTGAATLNLKAGTGGVVVTGVLTATSPVFTTPALGEPTALVGTNISGTAANLTAGIATNALSLGGALANTYASLVSPVFTTPDLGTPTALVGTNISGTAANLTAGIATNALSLGGALANTYASLVSPVFTTPTLGVATATSINGNTITAGTGTLTLGSATLNIGAGGTLGTAAFTATGAYATAAQGILATNALPSASFTDAAVTGKLITGYVSGAGAVVAGDTILQAINKLNGNDALALPLAGGAMTGAITFADAQTFTGAKITGAIPTGVTIADYAPLASPTFTGTVTAPTFVGALTGNASTATNLTGLTATIANLNTVTGALGTAAFTPITDYATAAQGILATNALPIGGGTMTGPLNMGVNNITMTGSLGATGSRLSKGWFTDIESTNMPTVNGATLQNSITQLTGLSAQNALMLNPYGADAGNTSEIQFKELATNGGNYVGFKAPDSFSFENNIVWTLPDGPGMDGGVLSIGDFGAKKLIWSGGGGPGPGEESVAGGIGRYGNQLTYSEQFDNAIWAKTGVSVTANSTSSPDGQSTADSIIDDATAGGTVAQNGIPANPSENWIFSVWIKNNNAEAIKIKITDDGTGSSFNSISLNSTWQRYSVNLNTTTGTTKVNAIIENTSGAVSTIFYVWGAQLEKVNPEESGGAGIYVRTEGTAIAAGRGLVAQSTGPHLFLSGNVGIGTTVAETLLTLRKSTAGNVFAIRNTGNTADTFTITDAGIVNLGTWQGSVIGLGFGGTGANTAEGARINLELGNVDNESKLTMFTGPTFTGQTKRSVQAGITANAGGGQENAVAITADIAEVTTVVTAGDSVKLPTAVPGMQITVINKAAVNSMNLFPGAGGNINEAGAGVAYAVARPVKVICTAITAVNWECQKMAR